MTEIGFEAAGLLRCRDWQQRAPGPRGFTSGRVDQQVRYGPALPVEQAKIGEAVLGDSALAIGRHPKRLRSLEQRRINREPLRTRARCRHDTLAREMQRGRLSR